MKSDKTTDLTTKDGNKSEIHLQGFLSILIFDIGSLKLVSFSASAPKILGVSLQVGTPLHEILNISQDVLETIVTHSFRIVEVKTLLSKLKVLLTANHEYLYIHVEEKSDKETENSIYDLLPSTESLFNRKDFSSLLISYLKYIRNIIPYDHLSVRQVDEGNNWQVLVSDTLANVPSYNQMFFPSTDIPDSVYALFDNNLPFIAYDLSLKKAEHIVSDDFTKAHIINLNPEDYASQLWENMGFRSVFFFPIVINEKLWGMLTAMHKIPKKLRLDKLAAVKYLTQILATKIQVKYLQEKQENSNERKKANLLLDHLSEYTDLVMAVKENHIALCNLLNANGISLFVADNAFHFANTPPAFITKEIKQKLIDEFEAPYFQTNNLAVAVPTLQSFKNHVSGLISVQLNPTSKQYLVWYRPSKTKVLQWAGIPRTNGGKLVPRTEFDPWVEVKTGFSNQWTDQEITFAKETKNVLSNISKYQYQNVANRKKIFKLIFRHSTDLIAILNEDFTIRHVSDVVKTTFGDEINKGKTKWEEFVHPEDLDKVKNYLIDVISNKPINGSVKYRIKNYAGNYIHFETFASNYLDNPIIKGILCNTRDITQKTFALNNLSKFQKIIETANSAILIVDTKRKAHPIIYTNNGIKHFINKSRQAVIGRSWQLVDDYIEETKGAVLFRAALKKGKSIEATLKIKNVEDQIIWVQAQVSPVEFKRDGLRNDVVIIFSDITSEVNAKEKLKEYSEKLHLSNLELQTFAYVASHDLKEPLRTIAGFSELFAETYQDKINQEANEYLSFILQATGRMKKLINDLLYFSRLSTEKGFIKEIDVAGILTKAVDNLHTLIEENKAIITNDILPNILVNETLLLQVFQNLISNAIKYRKDEQPKIHVSAKRKKNTWVFGIEDNGIGISEKYFDRIFVIFQRLHTSDQYSGTGIGLAICKKIIEKYGGKIWVESKEGEGSTFYFTIPDVLVLR